MPRKPSVWWHKGARAWCSEVGEREKSGGRAPVYFRYSNSERGKRAAQKALEAYIAGRDKEEKQGIRLAGNPTVDLVVEVYLQDCLRRVNASKMKQLTYDSYLQVLTIWKERYGARLARSITSDDLLRITRDWEESRKYGAWFVGRFVRSVKTCWAWAARPEFERPPLIPADPLAPVSPPPNPRKRTNYATRRDVARLLRESWRWANHWVRPKAGRKCGGCLTPPEGDGRCQRSHSATAYLRRSTALLFRLAFHVGCRPGELCAATWDDWTFPAWIDPAERKWGAITLLEHKTDGTEKVRTLIVPPAVARAVERWRAAPASVEGSFIWGHRRGKGYGVAGEAPPGIAWNTTGLGAVLRRLRGQAGVPPTVTMYTLRHTYLSDARMGGVSDALAASVAGTSPDMIERHYGHILDEAMARTAETIAMIRRRKR